MTLRVLQAGLQTSVQAGPRVGLRHLAVPAGGAADLLSLALANRLVGNAPTDAGLEITLSGACFECTERLTVAVTGAQASVAINGQHADMHATLRLNPGDQLEIGAAETGARSYLAIAGTLDVPHVLGSQSTCMAAHFGGFDGRALAAGEYAFASYLIKIALDNALYDPEFIVRYLQTRLIRHFFNRHATSTAGNYNINTEVIKKVPVPIVSLRQQQSIVSMLKKVEASCILLEDHLARAKALQGSLTNQVF